MSNRLAQGANQLSPIDWRQSNSSRRQCSRVCSLGFQLPNPARPLLVQAEAAVERGYWQQKRLMNPLRSRLQNDSIRDEMRILLNGGPLPGIALAGMHAGTCVHFRPPSGNHATQRDSLWTPRLSDLTDSET